MERCILYNMLTWRLVLVSVPNLTLQIPIVLTDKKAWIIKASLCHGKIYFFRIAPLGLILEIGLMIDVTLSQRQNVQFEVWRQLHSLTIGFAITRFLFSLIKYKLFVHYFLKKVWTPARSILTRVSVKIYESVGS